MSLPAVTAAVESSVRAPSGGTNPRVRVSGKTTVYIDYLNRRKLANV